MAVGIAWVVHYFEVRGLAPGWLSVSAKVAEVAIWIVDLVVFGLFILAELLKSCRAFAEDIVRK